MPFASRRGPGAAEIRGSASVVTDDVQFLFAETPVWHSLIEADTLSERTWRTCLAATILAAITLIDPGAARKPQQSAARHTAR